MIKSNIKEQRVFVINIKMNIKKFYVHFFLFINIYINGD